MTGPARSILSIIGAVLLLGGCATGLPLVPADPPSGIRPLQTGALESLVPDDSRLLDGPEAVERFLVELDGSPPDWARLHHSHGAHGEDHGLLWEENHTRNRARSGHPLLEQPLTYVWTGTLTSYYPAYDGFGIAIGPKHFHTRWGTVRFKAFRLPVRIVVVPPAERRDALRRRVASGEDVHVQILFTGRLLPNESVIYAFSHENPGEGVVMPVVRLDHVAYRLAL